MVVLAVGLFGLGMGIVAFGLIRTRQVMEVHSPEAIAAAADVDETPAAPGLLYRAMEPVLRAGGNLARRVSPASRVELIRQRIVMAGLENSMTGERILSYKAAGGLLGLLFGLIATPGQMNPVVWGVLVGGLFSFAPDIWIDSRARERQTQIARDLPEALDLLAITVEAGLGLEQALALVTENMQGPLGAEFSRLLREVELGVSRREALANLRTRTNVSEFSAFVAALIQADQVGAPIADVLKVQAGQVRLKRRQRAREKAAKTPVKILFPVIFGIFPAIFVVTVGPAAINIAREFLGL